MSTKSILASELENKKLYGYLSSAVVPRPIAFVSSISKDGEVNLAPYSFFNVFGVNPSTLVFSPVTRVRDGSNKDTLKNVEEVGECVINMVNYAILEQMSLTSGGFDHGIDEFEKAKLTPIASEHVRPPRVKESPVSLECKVRDIIKTGDSGGAGNLVVCEVIALHIDESVLTDNYLDARKMDMVGRMGGETYVRASGEAIFDIPSLKDAKVIGIDALPDKIKTSPDLSGNELARLGSVLTLPTKSEIEEFEMMPDYKVIVSRMEKDKAQAKEILLERSRHFLFVGQTESALMLLMLNENQL